jgi:hypothetical protein
MKVTKILIINVVVSCLVLFTVFSAAAQDTQTSLKDKTPEQRAQFMTDMMKSKLSLDSVQLTKVQDINLKYAREADPVIKGDGGRFSKLRQLKSIQNQKDKELKTVFTVDQYKQYQELEAAMREKMKNLRN